jgi:hypothetical protein
MSSKTMIFVLVALLVSMAGGVSAQSTTSGAPQQSIAAIAATPNAPACSKRVGLLGGYFGASIGPFLTANGHAVSNETGASIAGGALASLDVLYVLRDGSGAAAANATAIEAWVRGGGVLIAEFSATAQLLDGATYGFFSAATLSNSFAVPSGTVCGGNTVNMNAASPLANGLPLSWSCSGDPIGVLHVYQAATLDPGLTIAGAVSADTNNDGTPDAVVGNACMDRGAVVAFFSDFADWTSLQNPRTCGETGISCQRSVEDEILLLNAVCNARSACMIEVAVDIKPTSCPNPLNTGQRGVVPVAILGAANFDVSRVDPASVRIAGVAPLRWSMEDVATPYTPYTGKQSCMDCTTSGPDGFMDLDLKFDAQQLAAALGQVSDRQCLAVTLTGNLKAEFGGTPIKGEDVLRILLR